MSTSAARLLYRLPASARRASSEHLERIFVPSPCRPTSSAAPLTPTLTLPPPPPLTLTPAAITPTKRLTSSILLSLNSPFGAAKPSIQVTEQAGREESEALAYSPEDFSEQVRVEGVEAVLVEGEGGQGLQAIQRESGARVQVLGGQADAFRDVWIFGSAEAVRRARALVEEVTRTEVVLAGHQVPLLDQRSIAEIERASRTRVVVKGREGDEQRPVGIVGTEEARGKARGMILAMLYSSMRDVV